MKYIIYFLLFTVLPVSSQTIITPSEVKEAGLYIVDITTVNREEPQGEIVYSLWQPDLYNIEYSNKVPCRIVISLDNDTLYDSGPYEKNVTGATIRINGNTTALFSDPLNMPYKIKLEQTSDLLCRGNDEVYGDKHWRLLKDAVSLNTIVGLKLSKLIGMEWTPEYLPCNVIINGDYRGCYLLIETIKRNKYCRINCDKQTGFIIERDPYWWKENKYFSSNWYGDETNSMYRWTWKYPDEDIINDSLEQYIQQYINTIEHSLEEGNYDEFIDINSWSKWILAHDILGTRDSGGANMYFKKYDNSEKSLLEMPCLWDFDSNYEITPGSFSRLHTSSHAYFSQLFNRNNNTFIKNYTYLWNKNKKDIIDKLITFINEYVNTNEALSLEKSRELYNKRWGYSYGTVNNDAQAALQWFDKHIELLDNNIQQLNVISTDNNIKKNIYTDYVRDFQYYNLQGIKIENIVKENIFIQRDNNGKVHKVISR